MSTEPYTPSDEQIREAATRFEYAEDEVSFDRWLAQHDARVKAEALREAAQEFAPEKSTMYSGQKVRDRINDRADQIEKGGDR